jgi:flagellar biosynthetic protein FliO
MELVSQITAVAAVLGLLGATLWWLRRRGIAGLGPAGRAGRRRLECLERLSLGPQQTLHLIRLGEKALLLASSPAGCALIETLPLTGVEASRDGVR